MELTEREQSLYDMAIEMWGTNAQLLMVVEECAELIQAVCKMHRVGGEVLAMANRHLVMRDLREEAADVEVMLGQLQRIIGPWEDEKEVKLTRLSRRIVAHTEAP